MIYWSGHFDEGTAGSVPFSLSDGDSVFSGRFIAAWCWNSGAVIY